MLDPFLANKYNQKADKVDFPIFENISFLGPSLHATERCIVFCDKVMFFHSKRVFFCGGVQIVGPIQKNINLQSDMVDISAIKSSPLGLVNIKLGLTQSINHKNSIGRIPVTVLSIYPLPSPS